MTTRFEKNLQSLFEILPKEKLSVLLSDDDKSANYIINNSDKVTAFFDLCMEIMNANTNKRLASKIRRIFTENQDLAMRVAERQSSNL